MYCWIVESIGLVRTVLLDTGVWNVGMDFWILESGELVCTAGY
jgi:glucose dehydrogenase